MRKFLFFLLFVLIPPQLANAVLVEIKIPEILEGKFVTISHNSSFNLLELKPEFYNSGSTPYKTRVRLDLFNNSNKVFTGWSKEKTLMPGDRKTFEIYYFTNSTGNFTLRARAYFGNEIIEQNLSFEKSMYLLPKSVFRVENFRAYENFAVFDLISEKSVRDAIIIPSDFPLGWIFEQEKIDYLPAGDRKVVVLHYLPSVWRSENFTISIVAEQGTYHTEKTLSLKKEIGILGFVHYLIDRLKIAIHK